jgi:GT2 family glycosyltransferase
MPLPRISIIVVNWNGKKWLDRCFRSLTSQTYPALDIICVDNGSTDESVAYLKQHFPQVRLVESRINLGFAGGNNLGIAHAQGELLLLLNNDTWVESDFVDRLYEFYHTSKADVVGPHEGYYDSSIKKLDVVPVIDPLGHPVQISVGAHQPFYLSGVAILFAKSTYIQTGGLDNDFFMYLEEIDWFWRLRLLQKKIAYTDSIKVYHAGSGSTGSGVRYKSFLWRNQNTPQMLLKNYRWYTLLWVLPLYYGINTIEMCAFLLVGKPKISWSYLEGWWHTLVHLRTILHKRGAVQRMRIASDRDILRCMYPGSAKLMHLYIYLSRTILTKR